MYDRAGTRRPGPGHPAPQPAEEVEDPLLARPAGPRLAGVDVARAVALVMIVGAHVLLFSTDDGEPTSAYVRGSEGAALFALLAGAGVGIAYGRRPAAGARAWTAAAVALTVRAAALVALGLALGHVVDYEEHAVVVLTTFGLLFLLAVPLLRLGPVALAVLAAVLAVVVPVATHLLRPVLPTPQVVNPTLGDVAAEPWAWLAQVTLTGIYPALAWAAYLCAGMALGRLDLSSTQRVAQLLLGGIALALLASLTSWLLVTGFGGADRLVAAETGRLGADGVADGLAWGLAPDDARGSLWWLAVDAPHSSTPLDLLRTTGVAVAVTAGCLLLSRVLPAVVVRPLAAVGSLTLTLYTLHLLALTWFPDAWGEPLTLVAHVAVGLVLAPLWLRVARRGPVESVVRGLETAAARAVR
ncbi:heparan-alpha-glucosaminide N-acetyltransferase domain-containing protein [Geodermatophilus sp. DSM 44513]|uniref:heparan-alpha-glucosaminide N-acetyltransferase domain-containing protein n=1 Tax=Geodermatophilus sp. DSM 44513 TaxID=1528104 RepID=UPI0012798C97|nr:heparan-alpha-glucosaminide N-acetyltransferase domain-containing protein [Geodermatophilus sp. DSM 44513]WNV76559.1 heparan-alpha-glucosaminide N-acetyltransferase domain-containing protein [Geodermatophilus sp. DSM 44513]